jgi:hypothetical protein
MHSSSNEEGREVIETSWMDLCRSFVGGYSGIPSVHQGATYSEVQDPGESFPLIRQTSLSGAETKNFRLASTERTFRPVQWRLSPDECSIIIFGRHGSQADRRYFWIRPLSSLPLDEDVDIANPDGTALSCPEWIDGDSIVYPRPAPEGGHDLVVERTRSIAEKPSRSVLAGTHEPHKVALTVDRPGRRVFSVEHASAGETARLRVFDDSRMRALGEVEFSSQELPLVSSCEGQAALLIDGNLSRLRVGGVNSLEIGESIDFGRGRRAIHVAAIPGCFVCVIREESGGNALARVSPEGAVKVLPLPAHWRVIRIAPYQNGAKRVMMHVAQPIPPAKNYSFNAESLVVEPHSEPMRGCRVPPVVINQLESRTARFHVIEPVGASERHDLIILASGRGNPLMDIGANGAIWSHISTGGSVAIAATKDGRGGVEDWNNAFIEGVSLFRNRGFRVSLWGSEEAGIAATQVTRLDSVMVYRVAHSARLRRGQYQECTEINNDVMALTVMGTAFHGKSAQGRSGIYARVVAFLRGDVD